MPDLAREIWVLRSKVSFTGPSPTCGLHRTSQLHSKEPIFLIISAMSSADTKALMALLFSQLVRVPESRSTKAKGLLRS